MCVFWGLSAYEGIPSDGIKCWCLKRPHDVVPCPPSSDVLFHPKHSVEPARWHHDTTKDHLLNSRDIRHDCFSSKCPEMILLAILRSGDTKPSIPLRVAPVLHIPPLNGVHCMCLWRLCELSLSVCCSVSLYWTGCENKSPSGTIKSKAYFRQHY